MKKLLSALLMATCIFGLTACAGKETAITYNQGEIEYYSKSIFNYVLGNSSDEAIESLDQMDEYEWQQVESMWREQGNLKLSSDVFVSAAKAWNSSLEDIGIVSDKVLEEVVFNISSDDKNIVAVMTVAGSEHNADVEIVFDERMNVASITVGVDYSFGELMKTAALNTLLGMGTVFAVLILISLIISCFVLIPKIQAAFTKKTTTEEVKANAVDNTIAQIIEKEELSDDTELIAVIAAAIAASEGAVSTDGFVVRSIKRANRRIR